MPSLLFRPDAPLVARLAVLAALFSATLPTALSPKELAASVAEVLLEKPEDWRVVLGQLSRIDEGLRLQFAKSGYAMEGPVSGIDGPATISFEMKTKACGADPHVAWSEADNQHWRQFTRIPVVLDGEWRRYVLPLADRGTLTGVRFVFNSEAGEVVLRNIRVSSVGPSPVSPCEPQNLTVTSEALSLIYLASDRVYEVTDSRTARTWRSDPLPEWLVIEQAEASGDTLTLHLYNRFADGRATLRASVASDAVLSFSLEAADPSDPIYGLQSLPPRFSTDFDGGALVFCDRSCGVLLDQLDATYADWPLRVYGNTHCLDMPWVGAFDQTRGDGVMALFETPADAEVSLRPDRAGRHWPQARWLPSLDTIGYERRCALHFVPQGGYVALAKRYRDVVDAAGRLKTLAEKARAKPHLERLKGAPILWGGKDHRARVEQARALGVLRGVVNNCNDRSEVEWLDEQGYLVGRYDSYSDIFEGETSFQKDNIAETAVRSRPGGSPMDGWRFDDGRQMAWRSSAFWMRAAKAYVPRHLEQTGHNARFIDVAVAAPLQEDWSLLHKFDSRQDLRQRRELLEYLDGIGLVLGTEHGNDWAADLVDYHEGALSGPFWWSSWRAGNLEAPTREQLSDEYLKFGMGFAHRVPLWQLVYHDCLVSTWYWGDNAGMLYHAAPELADRKDLFTLLYGGTPLLWMDEHGYGWPKNQRRWLKTHHDTCKFFEEVAFAELVDHQFLSEDRALQRTRFSNGATVTVNFSGDPRPLPEEPEVVLAPFGYTAASPGARQDRLWINGQAVTTVKKQGWLMLESEQRTVRYGVAATGRITLFEINRDEWRLNGEPGREYEVDASRVAGWPQGVVVELRHVAPDGSVGALISLSDASGVLKVTTTDDAWRFALIRHAPHGDVQAEVTPEGGRRT